MRFTAERANFAAAVKRASGPIQSRNVIPILSFVHIAATDTGVKVRGTSMNEWVTAKFDAATTTSGATCVDAASLSAWLQAVAKGALIEFKIEDGRAVLTAGRATASFATMEAADFPNPPDRDAKTEVAGAIPALRICAPYASDEEARYYLRGVAINAGHAVAANGHILCAVNIAADPEIAVIVPTFGIRQIAQSSDAARLFVGANTWACEDGNVVMGGKLIDGTYPDWQRAVPKDNPIVATLDADTIAGAVTAVQMASGERARVIKIEGDGEFATVSCRGDAMSATDQAAYEGVSFATALNSKYAQTAMKTFEGRVVRWATGNDVAVVMTCEAAPELLACLIPMRA